MLSDMQFITVQKEILQSPGDTAPLTTFGQTNLIINECFKLVFLFTSWQDINFIALPFYFFSGYKWYMDLVRRREQMRTEYISLDVYSECVYICFIYYRRQPSAAGSSSVMDLSCP